MAESDAPHLPADWADALDRIVVEERRRIAVIGPADAGKSRFVGALLARRPQFALIDLDPGQKMAGPPGSVSLARAGRLERFVWIGSTGAANVRGIARGAADLARQAPFVANSSGFVRGLGARLQAASLDALRPDCIVAIGEGLAPILEGRTVEILRLRPSEMARRKPPALRARLRQAAFAAALEGADDRSLPRRSVRFDPAPPEPFAAGSERPVCALANGEDRAIGVLVAAGEEQVRLFAPPLAAPPSTVRLGRMWAAPGEGGWKLLEALRPAWRQREREG